MIPQSEPPSTTGREPISWSSMTIAASSTGVSGVVVMTFAFISSLILVFARI